MHVDLRRRWHAIGLGCAWVLAVDRILTFDFLKPKRKDIPENLYEISIEPEVVQAHSSEHVNMLDGYDAWPELINVMHTHTHSHPWTPLGIDLFTQIMCSTEYNSFVEACTACTTQMWHDAWKFVTVVGIYSPFYRQSFININWEWFTIIVIIMYSLVGNHVSLAQVPFSHRINWIRIYSQIH